GDGGPQASAACGPCQPATLSRPRAPAARPPGAPSDPRRTAEACSRAAGRRFALRASRRPRFPRRPGRRARPRSRPGLARSSRATLAHASKAIFPIAMPTYRELLQQTRSEISEIDANQARERIESGEPVVVDVREQDEWDEGHIPGAVHVPRGHLESRIERLAPDPVRPVVVYCSAGNRSAFAAKTLAELGYEDVVSLAGGFTDWKRNGFPVQLQAGLDVPQRARYSRHLLIPEVGEEGQLKLLDSKVLLVGAGGLGSPASLYLAAAGVGRIGIVDADVVDESNLQRQIVHSTES